ncbi:Signal recognition particle subunit SRP72 [Conoideocrella luteorostrata]|uniref:Signal recognition particle subunit SRP72 n=1 Tax=Conoideocrella luteorostrata TaxID=1105319 RepID=A0AAJ0G254_9HYPO|nr:Signal recognition particle subunit SRP72 [Conoideocrella luteorostrata]
MSQDPTAALAALLRAASITDHEEILKAANAALKSNKSDGLAQHTRVVALLKLDRFKDAYRAIIEGGLKLEGVCALEKAYALYKLSEMDEAATALASIGIEQRSLSHVAAQVAYRVEKFDEAQSIYNRLLASNSHEEYNDMKINIQAAQAQAEWKRVASSCSVDSEKVPDTFELCYNAACACIAQGSLSMASKLLQRALTLCDTTDELIQEEKEEERRFILAQQAFVFAKLGDGEHARDMYDSLDVKAEADADFRLIIENNRLALDEKPENPFLVERQLAAWLSSSKEAKLFNFQSGLLAQNSSIIDLQAHKINGVKTRAYEVADPTRMPSANSDVNNMSIIGAAAETHGLAEKNVLKHLTSLLKRRPYDVGLVLTIAQLQLRRRNFGAALYSLECFFSRLEGCDDEEYQRVRFSPGLIALAVSLKKVQKRDTSAKAQLIKAAEFWRNRPAKSAISLLQEAGIELVSSSSKDDIRLAGAIFAKLDAEEQTSSITSAGLVAALAAANASVVEEHTARLPSVESFIDGVNTGRLIDSGVLFYRGTSTSKKRPYPNDSTGERVPTKRTRRRLPKNFVEGQTPDPERWIPLRDRSSYRPKGKKGRKKAAESTQGGMIKEEETIGLVGGGGVKVERASMSGASKKKKKGKK